MDNTLETHSAPSNWTIFNNLNQFFKFRAKRVRLLLVYAYRARAPPPTLPRFTFSGLAMSAGPPMLLLSKGSELCLLLLAEYAKIVELKLKTH
jgi:hypothetical protein